MDASLPENDASNVNPLFRVSLACIASFYFARLASGLSLARSRAQRNKAGAMSSRSTLLSSPVLVVCFLGEVSSLVGVKHQAAREAGMLQAVSCP